MVGMRAGVFLGCLAVANAASAACDLQQVRFFEVSGKTFDVMGSSVNFPVDIEYVPIKATYNNTRTYQFNENIYIDFSGFQKIWPTLVANLLPTSDGNNKYHSHGMSVSANANGSGLARAHVTYENWTRICWKNPEIHGFELKWIDKCATNKNFQSTFVIDTTMAPTIRDGSLVMPSSTEMRGGEIPDWLSVFSGLFTFGMLEAQLTVLKQLIVGQVESSINEQLNAYDLSDAMLNGADIGGTVSSDLRSQLVLSLSSAQFINEFGRMSLRIQSTGAGHIREATACSVFGNLDLGSTEPPSTPRPPQPAAVQRDPEIERRIREGIFCRNTTCTDYIIR